MNNKKEQPIWKTYPDYPFLQANQFGEIRTIDRVVTDRNGRKIHINGRVLKQHLNKNGYMKVEFTVNGKTVNLLVHRIVATCFLPNPDNLPQVNHIDCNRTNNRLDNLEWCTPQYNIAYCVKMGHFVNNNPGHPVFAVDLKTGKVLRFESQMEAARQLGVSVGDLNSVIKGLYIQTGGYWFTEDESKITEERIQEIKNNMHFFGGVIAVNPETNEVFWFASQAEAARQLGINQSHICAVVKGQRKTAGGYWFCRADNGAVGKIREKFGNEIVNKVKELI